MLPDTALHQAKGKPYAETFRCPGGDLCLDFCNSGQGARGLRRTEWIEDYRGLIDWLRIGGSLGPAQSQRLQQAARRAPAAARIVWERALRLREAMFRVFDTRVQGGQARREDLDLIAAEHAQTAAQARIAPKNGRYVLELRSAATALEAAIQPIVESAMRLLTSERLERVGRCGNETCFWLFVDETRNRSRRWCEMASCGNLLKVRRHRQKGRRHAH